MLPEDISFILPIVCLNRYSIRVNSKRASHSVRNPPGSPRLLASSRKLLCRLRRTRQPLLCRASFYLVRTLWSLLPFSIEFKTSAPENFMADFFGAFWFLNLNSRRRVVLLPLSFEITFLGGSPLLIRLHLFLAAARGDPISYATGNHRHTVVNLMRIRSL